MPSSYSTNLRFEQQLTGENVNLWGVKLDATIARIDDAIAGYVALAITGDYSVQSANSNTTADEARRAHLKFTGTLAANSTITLPSVSKSYWIWNATNKTLTFTTGSGNTATVEAGDILPVWCDATNVKSTTYGGLNLKDYIAAATLGTVGDLPAQAGNAGKFVKTDGTNATWQTLQTTDFSDYAAFFGRFVALAAAL